MAYKIFLGKEKQSEIRDKLIDEIKRDIVGPREGEHESIKKNPKNEYLAGVLYPLGTGIEVEDTIKIESSSDDDNDSVESQISNDSLFKPSSFGLTCRLLPNTKKIKAHVTYGMYKLSGNEKGKTYCRTPHSEKFTIDVTKKCDSMEFAAQSKFVISYKTGMDNAGIMLDIYIVNKSEKSKNNLLNNMIFQPELTLESIDNEPVFKKSTQENQINADVNDQFDLLFHTKNSFGKGHLCAVLWDEKDVKYGLARRIHTTFTPEETVAKISPSQMKEDCTDMVKIASCTDKHKLQTMLRKIITEYSKWINNAEKNIPKYVEEKYIDVAESSIKKCKQVTERMQNGITSIIQNDDAFEAFKFANMAIAWQQTMTTWAKSNATENSVEGHEPLEPNKDLRWRLFQIAFILLNIEPLVNPKSKDRDTVDLLWFPTGGGKTEAYLGLATFLIAFRRLRGKSNGNITPLSIGTSVLMRYTLRLLTVQQFQRAAALMCACEKIRRKDTAKWGNEPFQVGLWVGGGVTPNKRTKGDNSAQSRKYSMEGGDITSVQTNNPYPLINCPWCGKKLNISNGEVGGRPEQWRLYCGRNQCMFSKHHGVEDHSLPVVVVDEDVYSRCPALIIGTVDKFAQIAWKPECSAVFGRVERYCQLCGFYNVRTSEHTHAHPNHKGLPIKGKMDVELVPPELIIQDELHLISGPLGSMVGIYETAIEHLCTNDGVKPKIIASTATTKEAASQISGLFNRDGTEIFPPQVVEFGDTFFSKIISTKVDSKTYLGVLGTGKSELNVMTRVSAVILRRIRQFYESKMYESKDLDPYFTLVSYFNSQRELGGASMGFKDSLPELISRIKNVYEDSTQSTENNSKNTENSLLRRQFYELVTEELTSRKASGEIPDVLRKLEINLEDGKNPIDLLLATNMLSVGVDISRLGAMIVAGQPKNNSEYIQATGRIGRNSPGLIVTVYSYTKPRDLSHYENFKMYHSALFKNVEAVSITPFTERTRSIALFGVLVGLIRVKYPALSQNQNAGKFDLKDKDQEIMVTEIKDIFDKRVEMVDKPEHANTMSNIEQLINKWIRYINNYSSGLLRYADSYDPRASKTLKESFYYLLQRNPNSTKELIPTPTSLRNAEQEQRLFYMDMHMEDENE